MVKDMSDRIESLQRRLKALKAQKSKTDARRRSRDSRQSRREETRRKILVGAIVLAKVEQGEMDQALLRRWLEETLDNDEDRALFDLSTSAIEQTSESPASSGA